MNQSPSLSFLEAIKKVLANYANFKGRARRSEFWWWYLFTYIVNWIVCLPLNMLVNKKTTLTEELSQQLLNGSITFDEMEQLANANDPTTMIWVCGIIMTVISIALFIPTIAVGVRRLHDVGKSGNFWWLYLVCGIGAIVPFIMCIPDGDPQPNQYGASPKYGDEFSPIADNPAM